MTYGSIYRKPIAVSSILFLCLQRYLGRVEHVQGGAEAAAPSRLPQAYELLIDLRTGRAQGLGPFRRQAKPLVSFKMSCRIHIGPFPD